MHKLLILLALFVSSVAYSEDKTYIHGAFPFVGIDSEQSANLGASLGFFSISPDGISGITADTSIGYKKYSLGASVHAAGYYGDYSLVPMSLKYNRYYEYGEADYTEFAGLGFSIDGFLVHIGVNIKENAPNVLGITYYLN
jgi:hypothetical protein